MITEQDEQVLTLFMASYDPITTHVTLRAHAECALIEKLTIDKHNEFITRVFAMQLEVSNDKPVPGGGEKVKQTDTKDVEMGSGVANPATPTN